MMSPLCDGGNNNNADGVRDGIWSFQFERARGTGRAEAACVEPVGGHVVGPISFHRPSM
jgi:hypothetical protein